MNTPQSVIASDWFVHRYRLTFRFQAIAKDWSMIANIIQDKFRRGGDGSAWEQACVNGSKRDVEPDIFTVVGWYNEIVELKRGVAASAAALRRMPDNRPEIDGETRRIIEEGIKRLGGREGHKLTIREKAAALLEELDRRQA